MPRYEIRENLTSIIEAAKDLKKALQENPAQFEEIQATVESETKELDGRLWLLLDLLD